MAVSDPSAIAGVTTLAIVNNAISCELTRVDLMERGIHPGQVVVILNREVHADWLEQCAYVLRYQGKPKSSLLGQADFTQFFMQGASLVRRLLKKNIQYVYIVNNDHVFCSHILCSVGKTNSPEITVVGEGLMNYQDIGLANRANWRWRVKPVIAALLGLRYRAPTSHLSGAYEPEVRRVVSFSSLGLKAPPERAVIRPFKPVQIVRPANSAIGLIVHTGLWQWMTPELYEPFARAFSEWVRKQRFERIIVKPHPRIETGILEKYLPPHEIINSNKSLEELSPEIEAGTVMGTCCTGLVTLKMLRPDLRCLDFGGNYYCEHAYFGDASVLDMMAGVGVELVPFG